LLSAVLTAGAAAIGAAVGAYVVPRRLRPAAATRLTTLLAVAAALAFMWMLVVIAGTALAEVHGVAERVTWCSGYVAAHRESITPLGLLALGGLAGATVSTTLVRRRQRAFRARPHDRELAVVTSDEPSAFALPGRPGQIVVTTAMLHSLDPAERRVLLAHEHAHLALRHHRYLRMTQLAIAVLPVLRPMQARIRYATERWADEEAARVVGDRALVARAIARAALLQPTAGTRGMAFTEGDVAARVRAMLGDPPVRSLRIEASLGAAGIGFLAATIGSALFVHHWLTALLGYCD